MHATCKEVHQLTSERLDRELSLLERIRVRLHLMRCAGCRNFDGQMRLLRGAMGRLNAGEAADRGRESR